MIEVLELSEINFINHKNSCRICINPLNSSSAPIKITKQISRIFTQLTSLEVSNLIKFNQFYLSLPFSSNLTQIFLNLSVLNAKINSN